VGCWSRRVWVQPSSSSGRPSSGAAEAPAAAQWRPQRNNAGTCCPPCHLRCSPCRLCCCLVCCCCCQPLLTLLLPPLLPLPTRLTLLPPAVPPPPPGRRREHKEDFHKLQLRGMNQDLSWDNAAKVYEEVLVAAKFQW